MKALPSQAGMDFRCPACSHTFPAPKVSQELQPKDSPYQVSSGKPKTKDVSYIYTACPCCGTTLSAPESEVGKKQACPDCHSPVIMKRQAKRKLGAAGAKPAAGDGGYRLAAEDAPAKPVAASPEERHYVVYCKVCQFMLTVTPRYAGKRVKCPDCGVAVRVPPPPSQRETKKAPAVDDDVDFRLSEVFNRPAPKSVEEIAREQREGKQARAAAQAAPIGARPKPAVKKSPAGLSANAGKAPASQPPVEAPSPKKERPDRETKRRKDEPFFRGTMRFFFYHQIWIRCIFHALAATVILFLLVFLATVASHPLLMRAAMYIVAMTGALIVMWLPSLCVAGLIVLQDTANGQDEVDGWPDGAFNDWIFDSLFVILAAAFSCVPGFLIGHSAHLDWILLWPMMAGVAYLLFPLALLSMLDAESPMMPFSPVIWTSPIRRFPVWLKFYAGSLVLAMLFFGGAIGAAMLGMVWQTFLWYLPPIFGLLGVASFFLYFRLLGRLTKLGIEEPDD